MTIFLALPLVLLFQNCSSSYDDSTSLAQQGLNEKALHVLKSNCATCHSGDHPQSPPQNILDTQTLIDQGYIVPGQPESSGVYTSLFANMPLGRAPLSEEDKSLIRAWILAMGDDGTPPAQLIIGDGAAFDFGSVQSGSSGQHTFVVENVGKKAAIGLAGSGLHSPFSFSGGAFPGSGGTCGALLQPGSTCTFVVSFLPPSAGSFNDDIEIIYADGPAPTGQIRTAKSVIRGQGSGSDVAILQLSDAPAFAFGLVETTLVAAKTFTLTNTGAANATSITAAPLGSPFRYKGGVYPGTGATCAATLPAGGSCTLNVEFAPTRSGPFTGNLVLHYSGPTSQSASVDLTGTGAGAGSPIYYSTVRAILNSSCTTCHDADWGSTYESLLAFKSGAETSAAIVPGSISSRFIARITGTSGGKPQMGVPPRGSLSPENRQTIVDWIVGGALNDPAMPPAVLAISDGPTYDFGSVIIGSAAEHTFKLRNTGEATATGISALNLAQPFMFKGGLFPGTGGNCSDTLAKGASCNIVVRFAPSSPEVSNANLRINYFNGQSNAFGRRSVSGTGVGLPVAVLSLSPSSHDFGPRALTTSINQVFALTNLGSAPATNLSVLALSAPYSLSGSTCTTTLAAGASCQLTVKFNPTEAGEFSSNLTVNYHNQASWQSIASTVTGIGVGGEPVYYSEVRQILNESSCNSCHSSHWGTSYAGLLNFKVPGRSSPAITAGDLGSRFIQYITNPPPGKPKMGDGAYGSLTSGKVQTIINWIANGAPDDPVGTITQEFRPLSGDRHYLGSVLHKVFGDTGPRVRAFSRTVFERGDLFGGACYAEDMAYLSEDSSGRRSQIYVGDDACRDKMSEESALAAETVPDSSSVSESTRQAACMRLTERTDNIVFALNGVGLDGTSPFNAANVSRVLFQFKPGTSPRTEAIEALLAVGNGALSDPLVQATPGRTKSFEGWRFIILSVCLSPSWISL
ncbi:MAG: choice-of-anchor D domain-containing protein [Bdellovibrionales bacterium]